MPDKVLSSGNSRIYLYLDDGTGTPLGAVLYEAQYVRSTLIAFTTESERIPHLGYYTQEIGLGATQHSLEIEKNVEDGDRDLRLTDALYYIRVEVWTDDRNAWMYYNCKKCKRIGWSYPRGDTGAIVVSGKFLVSELEQEDI